MSQFPRTPLEASGRLPVLLVVSLRVKHGFEELVNEELSRLVHTSRLETVWPTIQHGSFSMKSGRTGTPWRRTRATCIQAASALP